MMKYRSIKNIVLFGVSAVFLLIGCVILFYVFTPLPDVEIEQIVSKQSIVLEDRNGEFLFDFSSNERRMYTHLEDVSPNIINATIAIEDHLFFEHKGIRIDAFIRALLKNIQTLSFSQGGSTITQQVIKNAFLTTERKIERKMKEFFLAIKLEKQRSKNEILELYLNTIPYGGVVYGIGEASNTFFGKKPSELTIAESAYIAAIPNAPTYFSPYGSNKKALEGRKNTVLSLMLEKELITRDEYRQAREERVHFRSRDAFSIQAPHFVFFVQEQLQQEYGTSLKTLEGTRITTTLDLELQNEIEDIITEFAPTFEERYGGKNIASVVLSAKTGDILAMIGSRDFFKSEINGRVNIITSLRQPGSTFKPIVYARAFEKGLRPETVVYDVPTQFNSSCDEDKFETNKTNLCYSPINYTGRFSGPISLRNALAQSINIPAVKVAYITGISDVVELTEKIGIHSIAENPQQHGLSIGLGSAEVTPLELAQAYNVFANDGIFVPYGWLLDREKKERRRVLSQDVVRDITDILTDDRAREPSFGRNSPLNITNPPVATKTGTTNNSRDLWVVGYSPDVVVLIWGGNADGAPLEISASGLAFSKTFRKIILAVSERYGKDGSYFPINTNPKFGGATILNGEVDKKRHHTILHYIQRTNVLREPNNPEDDPQYKNWEFGVQEWLDSNEEYIQPNKKEEDGETTFSITSPIPGESIQEGLVTILATLLPAKNTQYEFYVNNQLVGASHLPLFTFNTTDQLITGEDVRLRVVANGPLGTYVAEEIYQAQ